MHTLVWYNCYRPPAVNGAGPGPILTAPKPTRGFISKFETTESQQVVVQMNLGILVYKIYKLISKLFQNNFVSQVKMA